MADSVPVGQLTSDSIPNVHEPDDEPQPQSAPKTGEASTTGVIAKSERVWYHIRNLLQKSDCQDPGPSSVQQIEDFKAGYPRFAALIGSHPSFHVCRRFTRIRARLLLIKQDELSLLEAQLDEVDRKETRLLFLGNRRRDQNVERLELIAKIDEALSGYDKFLERNRRIFSFDQARKQDIENLQNWIDDTSCLADGETAYLQTKQDLMGVISPSDDTLVYLERPLERAMTSVYHMLGKPSSNISRDPNISLFSPSIVQRITRSLVAWLVVVFLLVPIVILSALTNVVSRLAVVVVASAVLVTALSSLTNARTIEVFLSGATYATVLVVFISGNGAPSRT